MEGEGKGREGGGHSGTEWLPTTMFYGKVGVTFVYNSALRTFYFRGLWSATATAKIGGDQRKLRGGEP